MEDSVFTKIIKGEVPCNKIYEDDNVIVILTIEPLTPGHSLVIPKKQIEFLWDLDDETYQKVMQVTKLVANRQKEVLKVPYVGLKVEGVDVPHAHVHVIPFSDSSDLFKRAGDLSKPDNEELDKIAKQLFFS
jgi:histidine triad (HIT) family protein